jgi:hypothetical protein
VNAVRLTALAAAVSAAACVSPVDYSSHPTDATSCDPYGHDEDSDCISDKGDLCPMTPHAGPGDADGDGVGDACDPRPDHDDVLFHFSGFGSTDLPWEWDGDADWNIFNDHLDVNLLPTPQRELRAGGAYHDAAFPAPVVIVAQVWILQSGPDAEISLFADYQPDQGSGRFVSRENASMMEAGARFQLRVERDDLALGGPGYVRLAARDVRMGVEWVAIYTDKATARQLPQTPRP